MPLLLTGNSLNYYRLRFSPIDCHSPIPHVVLLRCRSPSHFYMRQLNDFLDTPLGRSSANIGGAGLRGGSVAEIKIGKERT
ncbi:hypothetical protein ACS0TY_034493 [Phlomoides rotata]